MKEKLTAVMSKFFIMFVLCLVFASCKTASAGLEAKRDAVTPLYLGEIPILAWWGVQEHTVERYRELKECGIDYNLSLYMNVEQFPQAMDAAREAGVKMILYCENLDNELESTVNRFKDHPALVGYFLQDEPKRKDFPRLGELTRRRLTAY